MVKIVDKKIKEIGPIAYCPSDRELIGRGGFALVYSGQFRLENGDRLPVAVKRIQHGDVNSDDREVNALKELKDHPNIVHLYGTGNDEYFYYFALELCAASMDDVFYPADNPKYKGPLPSDLDVLLQLSEGLKYIHESGFVHRDIKPGNVLISYPSDDGTAVVMKWADFGLSKSVSSRGTFSISGHRGTMNWIAPEILAILGGEESKETHGTVNSDTWSAGCVFCAYLTKGKHPFGEKNFDIVPNISMSKPVNLAALPNDHFAANLIGEMIRKEPTERIKLVDVVKILKKVKQNEESSQKQQQSENVRRELEAGQLYGWQQWKMALKEDQLFVWSDDVAIEGIPSNDKTLRIKLNECDKMKITSTSSGYEITREFLVRKDQNREMLQMVGITPGTPSGSPLNTHFVSQEEGEWTVCPSELGDILVIKGETREYPQKWEIVLFGASFHSTFHILSEHGLVLVGMTDGAKLAMKNELLDLCSCASLESWELDRIAALLRVGVDPNCTNIDGQTPLLLCLANQGGQSRLKCLKILLEGNQSEGEGTIPKKVDLSVKDREQRNVFQLLAHERMGMDDPAFYETLELLVNSGMDVNLKDEWGRTAQDYLSQKRVALK